LNTQCRQFLRLSDQFVDLSFPIGQTRGSGNQYLVNAVASPAIAYLSTLWLILKYPSLFQASRLACLLLLTVGQVAHAQPTLSRSVPASLISGVPTEVTIHGGKLTGTLTLWSPLGLKIEAIKPAEDQKTVTCKITADAGQAVGVVAILAANAAGISEPLLIMIDDLPPIADNADNHSPEKAQPISAANVVHGRSDGVVADYYLLPLEAGQKISIEVVAQRISSAMDPIVTLLDPAGRELVTADDSQGLGADCRFQFTCTSPGDHLLKIRDSRHQSGGSYSLRIGDFPIITSTFPLGGRLGATNRFKFTGLSATDAQPVILQVPESTSSRRLAVSAKSVDGKSSSMVLLATSDLPESIESEPNNQLDQGTPVTVPCAVNGVFQNAADSDCYEFAVTASQRLDFTSFGRSLGTPAYAFMQLFDEQGKQVAESAVTDADELTLTYTPPQDGMLRLVVHDLINRGGTEYAYRVEIRSGPDFSLTLKQEKGTLLKFKVPASGGYFSLKVQSQRRGYEGPIRLELENADPRFQLYHAVIPAKSNEVTLHFVTPVDFKPAEFTSLRIVGLADVEGRELRQVMHTEATLKANFAHMVYPHHSLDGYLSVVATAAQEPFFTTSSEQEAAIFTQGTEQSEYVFTIKRLQEDFKDPLTVLTAGLPTGFTAAVKPEKDKYTVTIKGDKSAPLGETEIRFLSIGKYKGRAQTDLLAVPFRVVAAETKEGN